MLHWTFVKDLIDCLVKSTRISPEKTVLDSHSFLFKFLTYKKPFGTRTKCYNDIKVTPGTKHNGINMTTQKCNKDVMSAIEPAFAFYLILGSLNARFQWIVVFYCSVRRKKKVVLFPEIGRVKILSLPHTHSRICIRMYIFV